MESKEYIPVTGSFCSERPDTFYQQTLALQMALKELQPLLACQQLSTPSSSNARIYVLSPAGQQKWNLRVSAAPSTSNATPPPTAATHTHLHNRQMPLKTRSENGDVCQLQLVRWGMGGRRKAMQISTNSKQRDLTSVQYLLCY